MANDNKLIDILLNKTDSLDARLDSIDKTLILQHEQLKQHIKRTEINEENIKLMRAEMRPVQKHVVIVEAFMKILGASSVLAAIIKALSDWL